MKARLQAGSEIDFLTQDELRELMQEFLSGFLRPPQTMHPDATIPLDASGNSLTQNEVVYRVPRGYRFRLHRLGFFPDGYDYGSVFTSSGGYATILRGGTVEDGIGWDTILNPSGLPQVWSAGTADGIDYVDGDPVQVHVVAGPASTTLLLKLQGTLEPIVRQ